MEYVWIGALVVFVVAEAVTVSLVSIWFALGSLAALIVAFAGGETWLQVLLFAGVSGVVLAALRPAAKKWLVTKRRPTNSDRVLGKRCTVTEDIDNILGTGAVYVDGKTWTARSKDGERIPVGQ